MARHQVISLDSVRFDYVAVLHLGGRGTWRMLAEARNLLAENDMYRRYEFTFLRQQVVII